LALVLWGFCSFWRHAPDLEEGKSFEEVCRNFAESPPW
jgi:hypothetical protein